MITTDASLKKQKPPESGRLEIKDSIVPGLFIRVSKTGKVWYLRGRPPGEKNPVAIRMGVYGQGTEALTLKQARMKATDWKESIKAGDDPRDEAKQRKKRANDTFAYLVERFLSNHGRNIKVSTLKQYTSILQGVDVALLNKKQISKITRQQIISLIDDIADTGRLVQANRTLAVLKKFFNWCSDKNHLTDNEPIPTDRVKPAAKEKPRARVLSPDELRVVWAASERLGWPFGDHIRLLIATAQRQSEVASISRSAIDNKVWKQVDNKADREHLLPLNELAVQILDAMPNMSDLYLSTNTTTPISGFSKAKRKLDTEIKKICEQQDLELFSEPWRTHDLRRTATTLMRKLGVSQDVCSRILNHAPKGITGQVYDVYDALEEKSQALQIWNNYLADLFHGSPDKVVKFKERG